VVIVNPSLTVRPNVYESDYPPRAQDADVQGNVTVVVQLDETGRPTGCEPANAPLGFGLEEATCRIFTTRARFSPRTENGRGVPGSIRMQLAWRLTEPEPAPVTTSAEASGPRVRDPLHYNVRCSSGENWTVFRVLGNLNQIENTQSGRVFTVQAPWQFSDSIVGQVNDEAGYGIVRLYFTDATADDGSPYAVFTRIGSSYVYPNGRERDFDATCRSTVFW